MRLALIALLLALILPPALAQQDYRVVLRGEPDDCIAALAGEGSYPAYSSVSVEARPTSNCRFLKWRVVSGLPYGETDANPLSFYISGDVELVAVFERVYVKPGGEPIERAIVYISTNITGMPEPQPIITMPGSEVRYQFEREVYLGEAKYVFLYAEADGSRYDIPSLRLRVPDSGRLSIKAYYYTYLRFINEYYPENQFIKPEIEPVKQVSDGVRLRATGYRVANTTFPLSQQVPRQLAKFVEPNYVREYRLRVYSDGAPVTVQVNGMQYYANPVAELWLAEGTQVFITAPERLERHRLESLAGGSLAVSGNTVAGFINTPTTIMLTYRPIPNAYLLDIPFIGPFLLQIADLGEAITGFDGTLALAAGLLIIASPAAAVSAAALIKPSARRIRLRRGGRAAVDPEIAAVSAAVTASLPSRRGAGMDAALRATGRIQLHPELRALAQELTTNHHTTAYTIEDYGGEDVDEAVEIRPEAEEALAKLSSGGKARITPAHIASLTCDIDTYDTLRQASADGRLDLKGGLGYLGYELEGGRVARKLGQGVSVVAIKTADMRLGELIALEACREAGLSSRKATPPASGDPKKAAAELRKQAGGAKALIHTVQDEAVERLVARAAPLTGLAHVLVSQNPALPPAAELPEPDKERYMSIAAALAASRDLLERLSHEHIDYLAELAYMFRGLVTLEEALARVEKAGGEDPFPLLRQAFRDEMARNFTPDELELITSYETVEELRSGYMAYVRQVRPGVKPEAEWARMYERLRRLGVLS